MKGQLPSAELADLPKGWRALETHALEVPGLDAARHLVILQRAADSRARSR
jgi:16S rRNA (guanine527-N7)-methyltransferase